MSGDEISMEIRAFQGDQTALTIMARHSGRQRPLAEALAEQVVADSRDFGAGRFDQKLLVVVVDGDLYQVIVRRLYNEADPPAESS